MLSDSNQLLANSPLPLFSVMLKFNLRSHVQFLLLEIVDHFFLFETIFSHGFQAPTLSWFLLAPLAPLFIPLPFPNLLNSRVFRASSWSTTFLSLSSLHIQIHDFKYTPCATFSLIYFFSQPFPGEFQTHTTNCLPDIFS